MSIEQTVYYQQVGQGEAFVLLHGWGVNSAIWQPVIEQLSQHFTLFIVDLPGCGKSAPLDCYSLENICHEIMKVVPETAIWCGWSLGGLIATYAAINHSTRVNKLIQVSSSVKFVADDLWAGVSSDVFTHFLAGLTENAQKTLTRFIALQAMGSVSARKDTVVIKKLLAGTPEANHEALVAGLTLLSESDLRLSFSDLTVPCLSLFGRFDSLIPVQIQQDTRSLLPSVHSFMFESSSHAPFISETELFCQKVIEFSCD